MKVDVRSGGGVCMGERGVGKVTKEEEGQKEEMKDIKMEKEMVVLARMKMVPT